MSLLLRSSRTRMRPGCDLVFILSQRLISDENEKQKWENRSNLRRLGRQKKDRIGSDLNSQSMSLEKRNVPREEQFVEVGTDWRHHRQVLDRAIGKIAKNVPGRTIASCYSQASGDDMLFIEIASNKMMDQFKEELHVCES